MIGGAIGLGAAKTIGAALYWADVTDRRVVFLHSLILLGLPYLGLVMGGIFVGFFTATEGAAMGAFGAMIFAMVRFRKSKGAVADTKLFHASRAQGLEDWIDPIDQHRITRGARPSGRATGPRPR